MKQRLDTELVRRGLVSTRSQAESYIGLGKVTVNKKVITKAGFMAGETDVVELHASEQYVSRAGLKLASVASILKLDFAGKIVLDVGSSTGGFTDYALQHGAKKVIAVDVGTDQMHPTLRGDERIELHEKTDIRQVRMMSDESRVMGNSSLRNSSFIILHSVPDIILIDVSFISLRETLPSVYQLCGPGTLIVAMVKPQFEAEQSALKHKGVIKNDAMRRRILKDFEVWVQKLYLIIDKADSEVSGAKGNTERFYLLKKLAR
jgi:23S rRNA (cytidine1920-2'-O)/16S rRNA (cytidine1409-2'-O)-methyltransferase